MDLDKKDYRILAALQADARQSLSALGRRIGLSQPAISDRVRRLEEAGVIQGYHARVNMQALGLGLEAIVRVKTTHDRIERCLRGFQAMPEVLEVWRVCRARPRGGMQFCWSGAGRLSLSRLCW